MIPYKLRLENFLSYRQGLEPLDFAGMHLVCLVGENGHGKSALLDAVTWALWGKARSNSDDEIMHTGSSEMQVEYEFGLGSQRYNVIRKRQRRGSSSKAELELAVWDEGYDAWQPITEPTIRATQERIDDILRMDYETFVNSAFLKQGEADAFTSKSPGQRKEILATILGLSRYDAYAESAKVTAKRAEEEARLLDLRLQEIEGELARRPQYEDDLRAAQMAEGQSKLRRGQAEIAVAEARLAVQALAGKEAAQRDLALRVQMAERERAETRTASQGPAGTTAAGGAVAGGARDHRRRISSLAGGAGRGTTMGGAFAGAATVGTRAATLAAVTVGGAGAGGAGSGFCP